MGLDDLKDKASEALGSDKGETVTDKVLDTAAGAAKKVTGGKYDDKIDSARDAIDDKLGKAHDAVDEKADDARKAVDEKLDRA